MGEISGITVYSVTRNEDNLDGSGNSTFLPLLDNFPGILSKLNPSTRTNASIFGANSPAMPERRMTKP